MPMFDVVKTFKERSVGHVKTMRTAASRSLTDAELATTRREFMAVETLKRDTNMTGSWLNTLLHKNETVLLPKCLRSGCVFAF